MVRSLATENINYFLCLLIVNGHQIYWALDMISLWAGPASTAVLIIK